MPPGMGTLDWALFLRMAQAAAGDHRDASGGPASGTPAQEALLLSEY